MNIYFAGIGGVGIGPLAEIALDAGYTVMGSDPKDSLMVQQMKDRGVLIDADQTGEFLQTIHEKQPIDWYVYTSALPTDHTELVCARELGIKTSKRDELLAHIIQEKGLKLIAIAGTHGKTTTTSMFIWAFKQLGIPVSYSVGTTMSFGPSGHYDSASEYFIYECDEYDRNFLQFHPFLSVIPALSYDHPDTYPTKDDYTAAFRQFLSQSEGAILWRSDEQVVGTSPNNWVLGDKDIADIKLTGEHVRQNASLVVKAFERLGIAGDVIAALDHFPGVDRRFEKLADNLYSDYAIHPREIAATLKMARELNDDVVVVYEPHQNVRQHEVWTEYTNAFELAKDIYWLPTYLTRENPDLPILTRGQLTKNLTNRSDLHHAELDDELWQNIVAARQRGALVVCMGAGTIDGWVRQKATTL
ncbi:MAG: murC [Candidatus Saccharibacteria bacterium]|nr:murC [Candidatus Saccharibacteria bacterium]